MKDGSRVRDAFKGSPCPVLRLSLCLGTLQEGAEGQGMADRVPARTCHRCVLACAVQQQRYGVHKLEIKPKPLN